MFKKKVLSLFLALLISMNLITPVLAAELSAGSSESNKSNYIIEYVNEGFADKGKTKIENNGGKIKKQFKHLPAITAELTADLAAELKKDKDVRIIEPDYKVKIKSEITPWNIINTNAPIAHNQGITGNGVKVAVFDTGINEHPELEVRGGVSFVSGTESYNDDNGHGTHVAGILSAVANDQGIIGVAPGIELYSVKVIDSEGTGNYSSIIAGIDWAIENNIDIVNMSFGGQQYSKILEQAVKVAYLNNILIFASAGNDGASSADSINYPAKYAEVISVGAIDKDNKRGDFSSIGPDLELVAPGVEIYSTSKDGGYITKSGTSMASPHAAGVAALLWSKDKTVLNEYIRGLLDCSAAKLGEKNYYGFGKVDAAKALDSYTEFMSKQKARDLKTGRKVPQRGQVKVRETDSGLQVQWGTEDLDTHKSLNSWTINTVATDQGDYFGNFFDVEARNIILEYADKPDEDENDRITFAGHFYDPADGENWMGQTSPTAYERFTNHAMAAKVYYNFGDKVKAFQELGMALHYLADLNAPHHAACLPGTGGIIEGFPTNHAEFEAWVDQNINDFQKEGSSDFGIYNKLDSFDFDYDSPYFYDIAQESGTTAKSVIDDATFFVSPISDPWDYYMNNGAERNAEHWRSAANTTISEAQDQMAGFLYRFVREVSSPSKVDLVIAIDTTASMWDDIDRVKASASQIVNSIADKTWDYRIAIVDYRDFPVEPYGGFGDYPYYVNSPFSNNQKNIISAIDGLSLGWGNDYEESVYSALMNSIQAVDLGQWREDAQKAIIVMGDAPPHDPEPFTNYTFNDVVQAASGNLPEGQVAVAELTDGIVKTGSSNKVSVYTIPIGSDPETIQTFSDLASSTGGKSFTAPTSSDVVSAIIKAIDDVIIPKNSPPDCSNAVASLSGIWPANNKMQQINILNVTDPDGDPFTIEITSITQDEPVKGRGTGNLSPDGSGVGTDTAFVRAERDGNGDGRVYKISFTATDSTGAQSSSFVYVGVQHDQGKNVGCTDNGQNYDSTVE